MRPKQKYHLYINDNSLLMTMKTSQKQDNTTSSPPEPLLSDPPETEALPDCQS